MKLLAVSYPRLQTTDLVRIGEFRKLHDRQYAVIQPHFTLIFPRAEESIDTFVNQSVSRLSDTAAFPVTLNSATVHRDLQEDSWYVFLVPSEGKSELILLYDRLNAPYKKTAPAPIAFLPHITIGFSQEEAACRKMAEEWNAGAARIDATVDSIYLLHYENSKVTDLKKVHFQE
jgi:2'-5' RNA ligase